MLHIKISWYADLEIPVYILLTRFKEFPVRQSSSVIYHDLRLPEFLNNLSQHALEAGHVRHINRVWLNGDVRSVRAPSSLGDRGDITLKAFGISRKQGDAIEILRREVGCYPDSDPWARSENYYEFRVCHDWTLW